MTWPTLNFADQHYAMLVLEEKAREEEQGIAELRRGYHADLVRSISQATLRLEALREAISVLDRARGVPRPSLAPEST